MSKPENLDPFRPTRAWGWTEHNLCIEALKRGRMRSEISREVSEREGRWERVMVALAVRGAKKSTELVG